MTPLWWIWVSVKNVAICFTLVSDTSAACVHIPVTHCNAMERLFEHLTPFKTFNGEFSSSTKHHTEHSDGGEHSACVIPAHCYWKQLTICVIPARCYWNQLTRRSMRSLFWSSFLTTLTFKWTNTQVFVGIFWFKAGVGQNLHLWKIWKDTLRKMHTISMYCYCVLLQKMQKMINSWICDLNIYLYRADYPKTIEHNSI